MRKVIKYTMHTTKKETASKYRRYICVILLAFIITNFPANTLSINTAYAANIPQIQSQAAILIDADTGQVLFEKNMHMKMYPASITKVISALIALEKGNLTDTITMSNNAVFSIGRNTSHIALDENEQITLEQALYAMAIASANDAANGVAEMISGNTTEFAKLMTARAKELGAYNSNFANAHGLPEDSHYTTAYDMARIMSAAIKIPEFTKMFSAMSYDMPPTNKQPEVRTFNRRNSLLEGPYSYDGVIAEKTGWTGDAGYTYIAAARRDGRTLIAVNMKSPDANSRWQEITALFDYGFNEFISVSYNISEFGKEKYSVEFTNGTKTDMTLIPEKNFTCLIPKSLKKEDLTVNYTFYADDINDKLSGKAVFALKPEFSDLMFAELGEIELQIYFNGDKNGNGIMANSNMPARNDEQSTSKDAKKTTVLSVILTVFSVILQIIGGLTSVYLLLLVRRNIIMKNRKKRRRSSDYSKNSSNSSNNRNNSNVYR